ncbi:AAC(3) family N-acetyltransferase [Parapedobacter tibetensis]|uniref:AAC(3) family N-acetyltransferase n=1 Tax=Parapedobacter tibetensis TaxID=2972951 RepID=UPI00214DE582|nr:AAC(3) family N-acetyltransferase [Parapedobacter tibetensis]
MFRTWPEAKRSLHPTCSFSAIGQLTDKILSNHSLEDPLGETSPLGELYKENAQVLLLGVGFDVCTMLHLAEQLAWPNRLKRKQASPIIEADERKWKVYEEFPLIDSRHFLTIGKHMKKEKLMGEFPIGIGVGKIISAKKLVDYAKTFWESNETPDNLL